MRDSKVVTFYDPKQVCEDLIATESFSQSPLKPKLVLAELEKIGAGDLLAIKSFPPFKREDFLTAHHKEYVDDFFVGKEPLATTNSLPWSPASLVESVCYTNASLYQAQRQAYLNPKQIAFSPTSGFHHAEPSRGAGFCTFSGQVISAIKLYQEFGISGAWIDLDAHYGNSIEDSRIFPELNKAIPPDCNINIAGLAYNHFTSLQSSLATLTPRILSGELAWIAFAHGADSHRADDTKSSQLSTKQWLEASKVFYNWVAEIDEQLGRPIPLTVALFGGYRSDDFDSVIHLHLADLLTMANKLIDARWDFSTATK